jgi:hypothetical protein
MSQWLIDNHRWLIQTFYGSLMLFLLVGFLLNRRQNRRDEEAERRFIESLRKRRGL